MRQHIPDVFSVTARAQLGRATEGIALIRQGIASVLEIGARVGIPADHCVLWQTRRARAAPSSMRLKRSNRRSRRIPMNSYTGPRCSQATRRTTAQAGADGTGRGRLPRGDRAGAKDGRESLGTARDDEPRAIAREAAVAATKRARCSPKSTTGSPKASTPPT